MRIVLVHLCLGLSGFAALLYQTAWMGEFTFVFGTSKLAVSTVLAAYMAGLASGAGVAARFAERVRRPVLVYGLLELGIAVTALMVPLGVQLATRTFLALFGGLDELPGSGGASHAAFFLLASMAILFLPTAMMGATLPLLARYAISDPSEIGTRSGSLYAINTLGAVAGTIATAYWLVPSLGLDRTVWFGVGVNALVFATAAALASTAAPLPRFDDDRPGGKGTASPGRFILPVMAVSGMVSFTYEVLWTRLLSHLVGGSVYAFATMLATFLTGIALGSAFSSRFTRTRGQALRGFCLAQAGAAVASLTAFAALDYLPAIAAGLRASLDSTALATALTGAGVLLPGALFIGGTFPLAVRILARDEHDAARANGRVFAWNTAGAIFGSIGAGFVFVPMLGYVGTILAAASTNLLLSGVTAIAIGLSGRWLVPAIAGGITMFYLHPTPPGLLLRSGAAGHVGRGEISYLGVGRSATVLLLEDSLAWALTTDGLPEATISKGGVRPGKYRSERWLTALPVFARPELESLLVVGLGGGVAIEVVPASVETIDVVEIEAQVVVANQHVASERAIDPLADPRVRLHVNDARGALLVTDRTFDAIVSQPSHPWTAAASHLYTREFFELVSSRLASDGVFVQWMGMPFVDEALLRILLATLTEAFPHVRVYHPSGLDLLFIASHDALPVEQTAARALERNQGRFLEAAVSAPEDVALRLVFDENAVRNLAAGARVNTDRHNFLQSLSPQVGKNRLSPALLEALLAGQEPPGQLQFLDGLYLVDRLARQGRVPRATELGRALLDPHDAAVARAIVSLRQGRLPGALQAVRTAARLDPDSPRARFLLEEIRHRTPGQIESATWMDELSSTALPDPAGAVVEIWQQPQPADSVRLRALDRRLASPDPRALGQRSGLRLRIRWRLESGDPALLREARQLADELIAMDSLEGFVLRARASVELGETHATISDLFDLARRRPLPRALVRESVAILDGLPNTLRERELRANARNLLKQAMN